MECPVCYEEYDHAPYCPKAIEIEDAEYEQECKEALQKRKRANKPLHADGGTVRQKGTSKRKVPAAKSAGRSSRK